jgi:lipopolysaccharide export system protein LptA
VRLPARPLALALALAATGVGVAAARTPLGGAAAVLGGDPLDMSAEHLDLDVASKTAVLTGAVQVKKGAVTVTCPRVDVRYDEVPHVTWIKGSGGVVAAVEGVRAEAPEVELDVARQVLELRGGVKLTRGSGWLTAERASIQVATGKVSMSDVRGSIPAGRASSSAVAPPSAPAASAAPNAAP